MNVRLMIQKTKPDKAGACPIYVEVSINPKEGKKDTKRVPTGEKIAVRYWSKKQEVMSSYSGYKEVNSAILKKKLEVQQIIRDNPDLTPAEIKQLAEKKVVARPPSMLELYEDFVQYKRVRLTPNGMKAIGGLYGLLKSYAENGNKLTLKDLGHSFYDSFFAFAATQGNHSNTIGKRFQTFKTFLNYLTDRGLNSNLDYKKWKLPRAIPTKMTTLSYDELTRIFNLEISNERLAKVRDMFIMLCTTGLRYSDGKSLKPYSVVQDSILVRADKTNEIIAIPLNNFSRSILKKYSNDLSTLAMSNQKFNDYIKEVCKAAGLDSKVLVSDRNAKNSEVVKEKWEAISSHTGRRTFITLSLQLGIRQDVVMSLSGHKDPRSFKKYIDHTDVLKVSEMAKWDK